MSLVGQKFGKYELVESLGTGGMAEVYKAYQPGLDRHVAIKVLHRHLALTPDFVFRFKREAKSIGQLQHPHILHVIDFETENNVYYLVMDYIQGDTLEAYIKSQGKLAFPEALRITEQLAGALDYAHERGMIHRDIKPSNVMFLDQNHQHSLLTDFGMARLVDDKKLTATGAVVGTPSYMSPEAILGQDPDARTDIYSVGMMLYEMVTGVMPYEGDTAFAVMMKATREPLPPPRQIVPELPEPVEQIILKALEKNREQRLQSAGELRAAIAQILPTGVHQAVSNSASFDHLETTIVDSSPLAEESPQETLISPSTIKQREVVEAVVNPEETNTSTSRPAWFWPAVVGGVLALLLVLGALFLFGVFNLATPLDDVIVGKPKAGSIRFFDGVERASDFEINLDRIPDLPADKTYALWIKSNETQETLKLSSNLPFDNGRVELEGNTQQSLLKKFDQVLVTVQSVDNPNEPISDRVAFSGSLPPEVLDGLRQILFDDNENDVGLIPGAEEEVTTAVIHTNNIREFGIEANNYDEMLNHAEHVVNILDGEEGEFFADLDGSGRAEKPGNYPIGVRGFLVEADELIDEILQEQLDNENLVKRMEETNNNNLELVEKATRKALQIVDSDTVEEGTPLVADLEMLLNSLFEGQDLDENGAIDASLNEGGIPIIYDTALLVGEIPLTPVD